MTLQHLIAEAVALGGTNLCAAGHDWRSEGGRECACTGHGPEHSQTVYRCARCGAWDYGEPGGPGHAECMAQCHGRGPMGSNAEIQRRRSRPLESLVGHGEDE